jgi:predicted nucleic acid-binding protein
MNSTGEPRILLDCDVVIHFLKGGKILELPTIFSGRFVMPEKVHNELLKRNSNALAIGVFLGLAKIPVLPMPADPDIVKEYFSLRRIMDDGESACLAVAKYRREFVASSNITQIATDCKENSIVLYTTMDLLVEATKKGVMTDVECDAFIREVRSKGSRLPDMTIAQYRQTKVYRIDAPSKPHD